MVEKITKEGACIRLMRVIKRSKVTWSGHVARVEGNVNASKTLVRKVKGGYHL
jgi:hypothetical protein